MDSPYDRVADLSRPNPSMRTGRTVKHPPQAWTETTHSFLAHLQEHAYPASQRVVEGGFDDEGNEVLTWIDGDVHSVGVWPQPEESLYVVGGLLRELHEVATTFEAPDNAVWMPWTLRETGPGTVVSHGNIAPWHVVFRDDRPEGFIGWEYVGPLDPLREVAATGWFCAQLVDDDVATRAGLPDATTRARWLRAFLDGYGLAPSVRHDFVTMMIEFAITDTGEFARTHDFTPESTDAEHLWLFSWQSRAALWMIEQRRLLTNIITRS